MRGADPIPAGTHSPVQGAIGHVHHELAAARDALDQLESRIEMALSAEVPGPTPPLRSPSPGDPVRPMSSLEAMLAEIADGVQGLSTRINRLTQRVAL